MTSELDVDLGSIHDEEHLRRMWLETEDFGRKKEIRARMYKLREDRLKEFYVTGEMDSSNIGITKAPLTPSHGESIADQSFQSFKTKEIRDSASPTHELKYTRGGVIVPDTSGWNVVTSSEVSPDGKSYKTETLASTEGIQKISGGHSQFAGKNEHLQSASHKGDEKNFVKTASEKSNTQLQENIVVGDENNGRTEKKSSSVVSSSHVTTSKQSSYGPDAALDHQAVLSDFDQLVDSAMPTQRITTVHRNQQQQQKEHQQRSENIVRQEREVREYQQKQEEQHQQKHYQQTQNERYVVEDNTNKEHLRTNQTHINETNQNEQIRRKLIQEEVDLLAAAPGKIISRTVDYPDPNTKVITETKTLPDGTTVTTRKFETKSARSKTWSSSSNQKESTSSRTIVEDRAQRNRVEYVVDGKEKVIRDDYNERRITDRDAPQVVRDTGRNVENKHQTKEEVFTKETTQQKQVHDRVDQRVHKTLTKEEKIFQDELRKDNRQQDNIVRRTDKVPIPRTENLKDQVEVFETDAVHKTVKKDLNQTVRDSKLTSQDFIQTERGCSMVDHSRIIPEKYTTAPKVDSSETRIHVIKTQTEQQDKRGCVDVSREVREQSITHQQRPDHPASPKKPSQDFTTHGFPSVRPDDSSRPKIRDQDFTTQGFPSVKSQQPQHDPRYPSPDRRTSTTTQTFATQNVEQTKQTIKSSEQKTVTQQSKDFTTHGFPSVAPQRISPTRQPEDFQPRTRIQPDQTTQTIHETRHIVEDRTVRKGKDDDVTTHGYPSARPEKSPELTPSERSPRQPINKSKQPDYPDHTSQTIQVQQVQQQQSTRQSTDQQITRENLVQEYSSVKPDKRSPSTPHEGSPKQPLETRKEPKQQQTVDKHFYTETRETIVDRDQKQSSTPHYPDGSYPSKDTPQRHSQEPSQRYPQESTPRYPQEPGQRYPQEPSKRYPEEPGQKHPQEPVQKYPQEPSPRYPKESTREYPQEPVQRYPEEPNRKYPQEPAQRYPTEPGRSEYPTEKIPKGYARQPQEPHVTEIRTTPHQVQPDQYREPYPSTYEVVRPDQPHRPDVDDASSVTTERTDISDTTRKNRKEYLSTRVTVEVDAAHDAFARSLRCVSPVDQTRGSVKSLKSTTSSIRSSSSPDKHSRRSPSRESDTSKFSTSTITKTRDTKDSVRKSTSPTKKSPLKDRSSPRDRSLPKDQQDFYKPNEPADSPRTRPRKEEPSTRPSKKPEVIRSPEDTKASRYPTSVNEVSTRPGMYPSRPSDSPRTTPKKTDSRRTPSDEFTTSPTRKGTRPSPTIQTDRRTSSDTTRTSDKTKSSKFTKTIKVDNAILRDDTTKPKRPGKPQYSDDEGFEPESPRSASPSYPKVLEERPKLTTDLDSTDIIVQVNLKNIGRDVDLSTTITDTDSTTKNYRNKEFITRERDDTEVSNKKTTTVETTDERPEKETHFPTETGEPFYLISTDQPQPKGGKVKPPLNRSETYEERCRQILGMDQTIKDTKNIKSTITEDFITTERIVQEKDKAGKIPSPIPSPRSSSPRKHHTVTDNITITGKVPTQTPDQSPTRKPKGTDSSGYTTPKDSPVPSPYSSLSRKSTPRNTPTDSPYTRSPTSSPTRKSQSISPQRPVSRESIPRKPEFDEKTTTSTRFVEKTTRESERDLTKRTSIRRSPSPSQSPTESPERKVFRESPRQSPERYVPSSITIEKRSKEDSRSVDSTTKSVRKEPYKTEVCYEVTKPRSRSPSGSPRRNTPYLTKPRSRSPSGSPKRNAPYGQSPKRDQPSVTEKRYISTISKTNKDETKETDDIRRTRITKTTKTTQVKDSPGTPRYGISSPTRRPQHPEEPKSGPKKTTTPITSRLTTVKASTPRGTPTSSSTPRKLVPSSSPVKTRNLPGSPAASSPSRRSPSLTESEIYRRTKIDQSTDTRKIASTVKTTKTSTITKTEDQANHVTVAKIQLSPTPTRKVSSPEKKISKPEVRIFRPTTTPVTTKGTKPTAQPLRRPDIKKPQETATTRRRIEKQTVTVEDESDSSLVREREEVTVIRKTKEMPITVVGKTQPSRKAPVTERKESAPIYGTRTVKDTTQKMNRSTSDNVLKTSTVRETRSQFDKTILTQDSHKTRQDTDKPHGKTERRPSKHLATKTINLSAPTGLIINSEDMENVIIDIQQAKSSREPSPNKIIPTPVPLDEYTGKPRYPDTVQEPEEEPRRKQKVKNIPIFEEETNNYVGCYITEVDETVEKKTQKRTTEVSDDETLVKTSRTQRVSRESSPYKEPKYFPDGSVVDDECLLSVHDKVNKFINTAEEIKKPKTSGPFRREKPSEQIPEKDDCLLSVNAKVSKFSTTAENVTKTPRKSPPKQIGRPNIDEIDEDLRTDECILSVSEKVNKFINTAEKLVSPVPQRSPELVAKMERQISRQSDESDREVSTKTTEKTTTVTDRYTGSVGKKTVTDKPASPKPTLKSSAAIQKAKQVFENGQTTTPRQRDILSRPSVWEGRKHTTDEVRLEDIGVYKKHGKGTEEIFERTEHTSSRSPTRNDDTYSTKPLRSTEVLKDSVSSKKDLFETRTTSKTNVTTSETTKTRKTSENLLQSRTERRSSGEYPRYSPSKETSPSRYYRDDDSPSRYRDRDTETTSRRTEEVSSIRRSGSPQSKRYSETDSPKKPLSHGRDGSPCLREHSHRSRVTTDSVSAKRNLFEKTEKGPRPHSPASVGPRPSYMDHTMSSLEHIRRDSVEVNKSYQRKASMDSTSTHEYDGSPRTGPKFGVDLKRVETKDEKMRRRSSSAEIPHIEDIFDLELLEQMLHTVTGYEHRRRIRSQIRVVKKMIDTQNRDACHTEYIRMVKEERSSSRGSSPSPDRSYDRRPSPSRKESFKSSSSRFIETESKHTYRTTKKEVKDRSVSPSPKVERYETKREFRRIGEKSKPVVTKQVREEKPIWATKNILKKPTQNNQAKSVATKKVTSTTTSKTQTRRQRTEAEEDSVNLCYGIGPTDEDGRPLFGIKALQKRNKPSETKKVTGTVITEKFYSENGAQPVGERKVTVYSSSPDDVKRIESKLSAGPTAEMIKRERSSKDGITTVTRVEKISKNRDAEEQDIPAAIMPAEIKDLSPKPRIVRKGSVKEITENYIRKTSTSSISDKPNRGDYPKAGLILKTQSRTNRGSSSGEYNVSESGSYNDSGDESPNLLNLSTEKNDTIEPIDRNYSKFSNSTKSFLNSSGTKVSGVNEILDKMRNADNVIEDGDTAEDQEARSLLNKFLGASILMTGMESMVPKKVVSSYGGPENKREEVKTSRQLKTLTKENSSALVEDKTCDFEDIWDLEILKQLLEKSVNYEERRRIRARIRQLMAEHQDKVAQLRKDDEGDSDEESSGSSEYEEVEEIIEEEVEEEVEEEEQEEKGEKLVVEEDSEEEEVVDEKCAIKVVDKIEAKPKEETTMRSTSNKKEEISDNIEESKEVQEICTTQTTEKNEESDGAVVTTTTTKVTTRTVAAPPKPISPFAKFRQLDKQQSLQSPNSPVTPTAPGGMGRGATLFKFTDPSLNARAATAKEQLLYWCQMKTKEYENVQITNFSASWTDGLAFCALIHHFLPDAFDYSELTPQQRRHNFELAFRVADEKAGIAPLLDVEDMVVMKRPDWKCVFTYVQSIYRRFRNSQ